MIIDYTINKNVLRPIYTNLNQALKDSMSRDTDMIGRVPYGPVDMVLYRGFHIYRKETIYQLYIVKQNTQKIMGEISFVKRGNIATIECTALFKASQGKGYGYLAYEFLILKVGLILQSDKIQSIGGKTLWKKLATDPRFTTFVKTYKNYDLVSYDDDQIISSEIIYVDYSTGDSLKKEQKTIRAELKKAERQKDKKLISFYKKYQRDIKKEWNDFMASQTVRMYVSSKKKLKKNQLLIIA